MSRAKKITIALVAAGALAVGAFLVYFYVIREDAPAKFDASTLDERLNGGSTDTSADTVTVSVPADTAAATAATAATAPTDPAVTTVAPAGTEATADAGDPSGTWNISPDSILGYRVNEVLFGLDTEGAGRTNDVSGTLVIDGATATSAEFTVQMASITSDDDRRDGQFNGRIMSTDQFPTSTFVLTSPIDFGAVPAEGETITASATGDLTLRGVTNSVTFEVQAKLESGRIGILGNIPIAFSDYDIPDPSNAAATVKDDGLLEFVLVFDKA
jgi:polyisoprenoid-binding protein YceI